MRMLAILVLTGAALPGPGAAQQGDNQSRSLECRETTRRNRDRFTFCEIREMALAATPKLAVDGRLNGGVSVKGAERRDVLVRAKVEANAETESEARAIAGQVRVQAAGSQVRAEGPENLERAWWSVSYEVFVPHRTDLALEAHNGGIGISDVNGEIGFTTVNGGVALRRLAGRVQGRTTNGGLTVELAGNRWEGREMSVQTTNGGIHLAVPDNYSARLETGTVNGGIHCDIPVTVRGEISRQLSVTLGAGGPLIRATTTNCGVSIRRKS